MKTKKEINSGIKTAKTESGFYHEYYNAENDTKYMLNTYTFSEDLEYIHDDVGRCYVYCNTKKGFIEFLQEQI